MELGESFPEYISPCTRRSDQSLASFWLNQSDFGECLVRPSDSHMYPCLTPVYNGKKLDINPELVHAALSGISMKHYYGKCFKELDDEESYDAWESKEMYGYTLFEENESSISVPSVVNKEIGGGDVLKEQSTTESRNHEYQENSALDFDFIKPICVQPSINHRNSFWNLHKPELCKLTWPQIYVSTATVTEHLHEHLLTHGTLCASYHKEEDRMNMINRELNEYGTLKILVSPRVLPPDEKPMPFNYDPKKMRPINPKCRNVPERKAIINNKDRFFNLSDDDEEVSNGKKIRRSKEEFCLTIGKHIRKPPIKISINQIKEDIGSPEIYYFPEEAEDNETYYFNWIQYNQEESYAAVSDTESDEEDLSVTDLPCPPLQMDDFCRAAGKADFSDLRCNPDDF